MTSTRCALENIWLRVNSDALSNNARVLLASMQNTPTGEPRLMAVVKANGYGHGAVNAALAFKEGGASWFGVTSFSEAVELVEGGIDSTQTPILVFSPPVTLEQCNIAARHSLHVTVCDVNHVNLLIRACQELSDPISVHLKVDTGMGRLGLAPREAADVAILIAARSELNLVGVYTHFASALAKDIKATADQLQIFQSFCSTLKQNGLSGFLRHCANSSTLIRLPQSRLDMVRAGTILYGQYPSPDVPRIPGLNADTCELEARVIFVHKLPTGATVGYGAEHKTSRPTIAAVLPVGFADGITMQPASVGKGLRGLKNIVVNSLKPRSLAVKFGSFSAPVLGRVAMQMIVVDVTDAPKAVDFGDIAVVPARRLAINARISRIVSSERNEF